MVIVWPKVIPVLISISVIIFIAIVSESSRLVAAIAATMPLTAPLSLWVVYSNAGGQQSALVDYTTGLLVGIVPTLGFLLASWLAARIGLTLWATLSVGYGAWAIILISIFIIRRG